MLIIFIRTVVFYFTTMVAIRIMGKRQIGQLEPTELVVTIMISELATMPIQDPDAPLLNTLVAIFSLVALEILISVVAMKSLALRETVSGRYAVIIDEGRINVGEMKKAQLTVDELMGELRKEGVLSPEDVRYCILETGGRMSVFSRSETEAGSLPLVLVSDGKIIKRNLNKLSMDKKGLKARLRSEYGLNVGEAFLLLYTSGKFTLIDRGGGVVGN